MTGHLGRSGKQPCGECGEPVAPTDRHTFEDCQQVKASKKKEAGQ